MIRCQKRGERVVLNWNGGIRRWLRMEKKKKGPGSWWWLWWLWWLTDGGGDDKPVPAEGRGEERYMTMQGAG